MTINGRKKGNSFEVWFADLLRKYGFDAVTSRSESKRLDDKGVDIVDDSNFYFQLKAVERMKKSYHEILAGMPSKKTRVVIHKRNNKGIVAVMYLHDFEELLLKKK